MAAATKSPGERGVNTPGYWCGEHTLPSGRSRYFPCTELTVVLPAMD